MGKGEPGCEMRKTFCDFLVDTAKTTKDVKNMLGDFCDSEVGEDLENFDNIEDGRTQWKNFCKPMGTVTADEQGRRVFHWTPGRTPGPPEFETFRSALTMFLGSYCGYMSN